MKVVEIFRSIDGEGIRAGLPATFIRLYGCNLGCLYCDTRYGCEGDNYSEMSIEQIMEQVRSLKVPSVTVTGGEPMIHKGIKKLLSALVEEGYDVNVETNGTMFPFRYIIEATDGMIFDVRRGEMIPDKRKLYGNLFYTMDWKCASSGMEDHMRIDLVDELEENDVLKFVVGCRKDMDGALEVIEQMKSNPHIYFSPIFGRIEPKEIVDYLIEKQLWNCKVQIQMHKVIWEPEKRGV